ncbi:unnamed protein product, partial [Ranitomeya imitator]
MRWPDIPTHVVKIVHNSAKTQLIQCTTDATYTRGSPNTTANFALKKSNGAPSLLSSAVRPNTPSSVSSAVTLRSEGAVTLLVCALCLNVSAEDAEDEAASERGKVNIASAGGLCDERFTKNLSPEQINLSTLRGEGQLTDLQLDEEALQNMLDLPTWLAITRVYCNRAAIRMFDKVEIEMKTCEDPRPPNGPSPIALAAGQSEYGFAEKVVEGMLLEVGCVIIKIESQTFHASLQLWQLQGYSVSPTWQQSDLRFTRLTHPQRGEVLTFKQVTWQTLRIEADASESCEDAPSTPLRLLTNGGKLNIALKRRMKAGSHWAHVTEYGDAMESDLLPATSFSMTGLAV